MAMSASSEGMRLLKEKKKIGFRRLWRLLLLPSFKGAKQKDKLHVGYKEASWMGSLNADYYSQKSLFLISTQLL